MRVVNRLAGVLLGLVLLAGGLLVVVEGVLAATGRRPWPVDFATWYGPLTRTELRAPVVLACSIAVGVLGLLLFVTQVRRWAPPRLAVRHGTGARPVSWWVYRRSVERELSSAVDALPGVSETRCRLRGRGDRWRLTVSPRGRSDTGEPVHRAVTAQLERMAAPVPVRVRVALRRPRRVA
ncbi:hypothetical protein [Actinocatenispora rupis]|uniref:Alkaline shock response membrane anchor protein AmaP n=1 Tax=Actinocatenispora rupis TaxID=519421 RepID=A0A8J3J5A1_9ACTN|nr:hypothetical protein [Actinocatenispora rupis]GID11866.1 hypothetical protein Aru02nite_27550 [Actinocatenispora rupis]